MRSLAGLVFEAAPFHSMMIQFSHVAFHCTGILRQFPRYRVTTPQDNGSKGRGFGKRPEEASATHDYASRQQSMRNLHLH